MNKHRLSIGQKNTGIITITTSIALVAACSFIFINDLASIRRTMLRDLAVLAESVGSNCQAAISFGDENAADGLLSALRAEPHIIFAGIYTTDERLFAVYLRPGAADEKPPATLPVRRNTQEFLRDHALICRDVILDGNHIGSILVKSDLGKLHELIKRDTATMIGATGGALILAFLISGRLQRIVTDPIVKLKNATEKIGKGYLNDKIAIETDDEIGDLVASFNRMTEDLQRSTVSKDYLDNIMSSMMDTLIVTDMTGRIKTVNRAMAELTGYRDAELLGQDVRTILGVEQELFQPERFHGLIEGEAVSNYEIAYRTKDGRRIPMLFSGALMRDKTGNPEGFVGIARDITKMKEIDRQINASLKEKELLLREIHHRVKNNMQVIASLLRLQSEYSRTKTDQSGIFKDSQYRIRSMALIHEKLYQSRELAQVDFQDYIKSLAVELFGSYGVSQSRVRLTIIVADVHLGIDTAIPCGLIISELVSNCLKYAFPDGRCGKIQICLCRLESGGIQLTVGDDGIGMGKNVYVRSAETLGLRLVADLAEYQLQGTIRSLRDDGTVFIIEFKESEYTERMRDHDAGKNTNC